jgi:hypothetical protein
MAPRMAARRDRPGPENGQAAGCPDREQDVAARTAV